MSGEGEGEGEGPGKGKGEEGIGGRVFVMQLACLIQKEL